MSLPNLPEVVSPIPVSSPLSSCLPNDNDSVHHLHILRQNGQGPVRRITKSDSNISDKVFDYPRRCPNNNSYTSELLLPLLSHSTSTETLQVDPTAMEEEDHHHNHPSAICQSPSTCTPSNSSSSPKFAAPSEGFSSLSHLDQEEEEGDGGGMSSWFENENLPELHSKGTNLNLTDELSSGTDSEDSTNDELPSYEMNVLSYGEGNLDSWTIDIV